MPPDTLSAGIDIAISPLLASLSICVTLVQMILLRVDSVIHVHILDKVFAYCLKHAVGQNALLAAPGNHQCTGSHV